MKKIFLMLISIGLIQGCTSPDQNRQIRLFWMKQMQNVQLWFFQKGMNAPKLPAELMSATASASLPAEDSATSKTPTAKPSIERTAAAAEPIPAKLFLSNTCGWCQKLKQSGFPEKFKRKYAGEVDLKVYEVHSAQGGREFSRAIKKYNLSGGVPLLIIGNSVIPGYADNMMELADEKVRLEMKKRGPIATGPSMVSITMEDDEIKGSASAADKAKMKQYIARVQENNEATLNSMRNLFPQTVWSQALTYISSTEESIKRVANTSVSYADFVKRAQVIEKNQQKQIDSLVQQNTNKIR